MSEIVTELAYLTRKAEVDVVNGAEKNTWEAVLSTIAKQPGFRSGYWGMQIEHPNILQMNISTLPLPTKSIVNFTCI